MPRTSSPELLRLRGHEIRVAHDGPTAVETALRHPPDLVLLDIGLPDVDGYEVATRIRAVLPQVRIVAASGYGQEPYRKRSEEAGFALHLVKPVEIARLDDLLRG